jgi:DNA-binding NtrC family response regulator
MIDILLVDDDDDVRTSIASALSSAGHNVTEASDGAIALSLLHDRSFDLAVCDIQMPKLDGLTLFRRMRHDSPRTAVVIMTAFATIPDVVGSIRDGAVEFVTKPFDADDFAARVVGPIADRHALRKRFEAVRSEVVARDAGSTLVGNSRIMRELVDRASVIASSDASVLVTGDGGTGKKLLARTIHARSPRSNGPFVVVSCASLADLMLESELRDLSEMSDRVHRDAWFRSAEGGTLVLDGIDTLPIGAQSGLLRVLEEPTTRARRDHTWQPIGVRVISTARTGLAAPMASRQFLDALYFRLSTVRLRTPTLAQRDGDLHLLTAHILRSLTPPGATVRRPGLTARAWRALAGHEFRGNVRELGSVLERALALANGDEIDLEDLPDDVDTRS